MRCIVCVLRLVSNTDENRSFFKTTLRWLYVGKRVYDGGLQVFFKITLHHFVQMRPVRPHHVVFMVRIDEIIE